MASADVRIDSAHLPVPARHREEPAFGFATEISVIGGITLLIGLLYQPTLRPLVELWNREPSYPFGRLIPVLAVLIAVANWRRQGAPVRYEVSRADLRGGLIVLLLGLAMHFSAVVLSVVPLDVAALVLVLRGVLRICGGRETMRAYEPAALLLLFMIPASLEVFPAIGVYLARCTAVGAGAMLDLAGVPVYVEGAMLHLRDFAMTVIPATSGLRELQGVAAVCLAVGLISGRGRGFVFALAVLSLPIAAAVNIVRFTAAGIAYHRNDVSAAEQVFNAFQGSMLVAVATALVVVTALGLCGLASLVPARKRK